MAIVGIGVAAFAAIKGYAMLDAYPGYGAVYKRMRAAQDDLEAEITAIRYRIDAEMDKFLRGARDAYQEANQALQEVLDRYDRLLSGNEQYEMNVDGIEGACRNTLEVYREHNLRVRNTPPPAHFFEKVSLVRARAIFDGDRVAKAKTDLKARQDTLRASRREARARGAGAGGPHPLRGQPEAQDRGDHQGSRAAQRQGAGGAEGSRPRGRHRPEVGPGEPQCRAAVLTVWKGTLILCG